MQLVMAADDLDLKQIAVRILVRRKQLGLEQRELADRAGMERAYISRLENARIAGPKITDLRRVAKALGMTLDELTGDEEPPALRATQDDDPELATLMRDLKQAKPEELQWLRDALRLIRRETS